MKTLHSQILGEGKAFVILHGFLGMSDNWRSLGRKFSEDGYQVHLVDQRNHGRSFHSEEFSYELMVQDLKNYCEAHNLEEIILLGHSMGGKTAMLFATTYPKMVSKLIVADIAPKFYPVHHEVILNGLKMLDFSKINSREEAEDDLAEYIKVKSIRLFLLKNLYRKTKGGYGLRLNLPVLTDTIENIGVALPEDAIYKGDVLFLGGEKSDYIEPKDEALITKHFPKARINTISNAGHWLHAENPQEFYDNVVNFL